MKRIVFWGTYDTGKPRLRILRKGLRENGVDVVECHADVWQSIEDKSQISGFGKKVLLMLRWLGSYPGLIGRYLFCRMEHDAVLAGYLGQLDVIVLWPFARLRGKPVVWDAFLSLYDTVVNDRKLVGRRNPAAYFLYAWEWLACRCADLVVLDTQAHADFFRELYHLKPGKTAAVFVGAEQEVFSTVVRNEGENHPRPIVLFYGQFIPLHGIQTIVDAAAQTAGEDIDWVLVGTGQEAPAIRMLLEKRPLARLRWIDWIPYEQLAGWIQRASVCLGIFGESGKAGRVIPNKVFQYIMSGSPFITRDSPAMRELVHDAPSDGIWLIPPGDPVALASAVREAVFQFKKPDGLHDELKKRITAQALGLHLLDIINHKQDIQKGAHAT